MKWIPMHCVFQEYGSEGVRELMELFIIGDDASSGPLNI